AFVRSALADGLIQLVGGFVELRGEVVLFHRLLVEPAGLRLDGLVLGGGVDGDRQREERAGDREQRESIDHAKFSGLRSLPNTTKSLRLVAQTASPHRASQGFSPLVPSAAQRGSQSAQSPPRSSLERDVRSLTPSLVGFGFCSDELNPT